MENYEAPPQNNSAPEISLEKESKEGYIETAEKLRAAREKLMFLPIMILFCQETASPWKCFSTKMISIKTKTAAKLLTKAALTFCKKVYFKNEIIIILSGAKNPVNEMLRLLAQHDKRNNEYY